MTGEKQTAYDEVAYQSLALRSTHPDRLATIATLFGMHSAPVERCRVLELGCGAGVNIISMAYGLPESEFVGMDLASGPIGEGNAMIADLGLKNVRLETADLMEFQAPGEPFDYIVAHGIYSWTPPQVRDRILAICEESLDANGVAYVSYNAYPGWHIREMTRQMMLRHVRAISEPQERVDQGRTLLKFLSTAKSETDLYQGILQKEYERVSECMDSSLYHDDLSPCNQPFYFHEFLEHASKRNLQFLGEAVFRDMHPRGFTPDTVRVLQEMDDDILAREQYIDFLTCRRFRSTLLCRSEVPLNHKVKTAAIARFYASFEGEAVSSEADIRSAGAEEFRTPKGGSVVTDQPMMKAVLWLLGRSWPRALHFDELLAALRDVAPAKECDLDENVTALCELLLGGYAAGVLELHTRAPGVVAEISERPIASPLARYQFLHGRKLTTLWHGSIDLADDLSRPLLGLLDGSRDSAALADALLGMVQGGDAVLVSDGAPMTDAGLIRTKIQAELPITLRGFARAAVLVG
jgi:methyltransferase-like protein